MGEFGGNGGGLALQKLAATLAAGLEPIGADPPAAEMRRLRSAVEIEARAIHSREGSAIGKVWFELALGSE